jgi:nucleoid DNA-binding protein
MNKLDKESFIAALAEKCNYTLVDTKFFVDNLISLFGDCILNDTEIEVRGFGKLYQQTIPERKGFKPVRGKPGEGSAMTYPPAKRVIFRLSSNLRGIAKHSDSEEV